MRIRRPRGITPTQLMVVTAVGVIAGAYIWQPLILKYKKETTSEIPAITTKPPPAKNLSSNSTGLMAIAVFSTFAIAGSYRFYFKPRLDRQKRIEAEKYAEYLFERETDRKS